MIRFSACLLAAAVFIAGGAEAQTVAVRVRMMTALPEGTPAHDSWKTLEGAWRQASAGASELKIYGGGSGDEEMLRRLRAGQIQAALLTLDGAARLDPAFAVLRTPLFVRTPAELDAVLAALAPVLTARLGKQDLVLLGFAPVGWVRIFSTRPLRTVADVERGPIADWSSDPATAAWWKARGYGFAPIALPDVGAALGAGEVAAVPATPVLALALDWVRSARHMLDMPLVPALGVAVVQAPAWKAVDAAGRERVLAAVSAVQAKVAAAIPVEELRAIADMEKRGLTVERLGAAEEKTWAEEATRLQAAARVALVDAEILDLASAARDRARLAVRK